MGTVLPELAPHVRNDLGGSDRTIGFVIGIFSVVALAGRLVSGPVADNKGRKIAFLTGLASCTFAGAIYLVPFGITRNFGLKGEHGHVGRTQRRESGRRP